MDSTAGNAPAHFGQTAVYGSGLFTKAMMGFIVVLFSGMAVFLIVMAMEPLGRGGENTLLGLFLLALAGVQVALLFFLWPFIDAIYRLRIAVGPNEASFRLPARRRAPQQPPYAFTLPLQQIEKLATRIEMIHSMGQIQQMRQFALKANGVWIEYGGAIENSYNGMVGATGKVALSSVAALQRATGLQVEDHGVVEGAKKGEAGTPWGAAALAAPVAEAAIVKAGKNANMWRNIMIVLFVIIVAVRLIEAFAR